MRVLTRFFTCVGRCLHCNNLLRLFVAEQVTTVCTRCRWSKSWYLGENAYCLLNVFVPGIGTVMFVVPLMFVGIVSTGGKGGARGGTMQSRGVAGKGS